MPDESAATVESEVTMRNSSTAAISARKRIEKRARLPFLPAGATIEPLPGFIARRAALLDRHHDNGSVNAARAALRGSEP